MRKKAGVAKYLQLLSDFVRYMAVLRMLRLKLVLVRVHIGVGELGLAEFAHDVEHVQRPSAFRRGNLLYGEEDVDTAP